MLNSYQRRGRIVRAALLTGAWLACCAAGCGPEVNDDELGTIVDDPQAWPGVGQPYEIPQLPKPAPPAAAPTTETPPAPMP